MPGIPLIGIGKGKQISFGQTTPRTDTSDLWQEKLDEQGLKYYVDGEWKELNIVEETIKVKDGKDIKLKVKSTHRGPLIDSQIIYGGKDLIGVPIPSIDTKQKYSLQWGGMYPGDSYWKIVLGFAQGSGVKETIELVKTMEDGYRGITMNMIMADDKGDIGYVMLASAPDRLSKIPYIGSRVLDGQSTKYDWKGLLPAKEYPRSINPSKGFIATANNR